MLSGKVDFDLCCPHAVFENEARRRAWARLVTKRIRPLVDEQVYVGRYVIDLDSLKLSSLVDELERLKKDKLIGLLHATFTFRFGKDEAERATWYLVRPESDDNLAEWEPVCERGMPTIDTVGAKASRHITASEDGIVYVDTVARRFIEKRRLTGLQFAWMQPSGRSRRPLTLYLPIAQETLGRGLDHPWVDATKVAKDRHCRTPALWRFGVHHFGGKVIRNHFRFGDATKDRLLDLINSRECSVWAPRALLRGQLPKTDFAFVWDEPDEFRAFGGNGKQVLHHSRQLCVNRRTRHLLIKAGFLRDRDFEPLLILDRPPHGTAILDGRGPMPSPLLSTEQLNQNADAEQAFMRRGPKVAASDLESLIARLEQYRDRRQKRCHGCSQAAVVRAERVLKMSIPSAWQRVLRSVSGLRVRNSDLGAGAACEIIPPEQLPKFQRMQEESMRAFGICLNRPVLHVIDNGVGDFICLEAPRKKGGNCAVLLVSHETGRTQRRWKDVQSMLNELLAGVD